MAGKTYPQLTAATDVQDADLLASYRSPGPLKKLTAAAFSEYVGGELTDNGTIPSVASRAALAGLTIKAAIKQLATRGYATEGDNGGASYVRTSFATITSAGYPAASYQRSTDRFMPDGSTDATNGGYWLLQEPQIRPEMCGATGGLDDSAAFTAAAQTARIQGVPLHISSINGAPTVFKINNVDVAGLSVSAGPGVTFETPAGATGRAFLATGTVGTRITRPTIVKGIRHNGGGSQLGLFRADYADDVLVEDCYGDGYPMTLGADGAGVLAVECLRPIVRGGRYTGGRIGVLFVSCTAPAAEGVKTSGQGRDGVLFFTDPTGTTTTDAKAIGCSAQAYCINGEAGRAGIHFYGVRRALAVGCSARDDSGQTFDDTGGIRFRDCEDYACSAYIVDDVVSGVLVNEVGDYAGPPHNIVVRGSIGSGTVFDVGKYGVAVVTASPCAITGVNVSTIANVASAAGVYHSGTGTVSGCVVSDTAQTGIRIAGSVVVTGNRLTRCGTGGSSIPGLLLSGGISSASGNVFVDDRGSPTATMAIRVTSGSATIGINTFGTGITDFSPSVSGSIILAPSILRGKFAGVPADFAGTVNNGVEAFDSNGVMYLRSGGAWKRTTERELSATIDVTQTTVAHGLGYTPTVVTVLPQADARVWRSAAPDATNVYLTASALATVDIFVR